jgi:hypothetical protein
MMVQCKRPTPCPKRDKELSWQKLDTLKAKGELCANCATYASGVRPQSYDSYPRRNSDHRFEWTRDEFMSWAHELAAERGYSVRFDGVGGGPSTQVATKLVSSYPPKMVC